MSRYVTDTHALHWCLYLLKKGVWRRIGLTNSSSILLFPMAVTQSLPLIWQLPGRYGVCRTR